MTVSPRASSRASPVRVMVGLLLVHLAVSRFVHASLQSSSSSSPPAASGSASALGNGSDARNRGQAALSSVPEEDRLRFLIYHLAKALNTTPNLSPLAERNRSGIRQPMPQPKSSTFKDIQTYETFSVDLLKWTMRTFGASQLDVYNLVRRSRLLCTRKGLCFNPNDLGQMCCPF